MGKALAEAFPVARAVFDEVDAALGEKLTSIIWDGPAETARGSDQNIRYGSCARDRARYCLRSPA
jgi:hypothetical protein